MNTISTEPRSCAEFGATALPGEKLVRLSQHELAARLSYFLWASMPDEPLTALAESGVLSTPQGIAAQARSMLADKRARRAVTEFYDQWLALGALDSLIKDSLVHPEFTPELRDAMRAETPAFVEHVLWTGDGRLATLLTSPLGFTSAPLAALYGVAQPAGAGPRQVALAPQQRAGLLTQAGFLAVHALPNQSSPVTRGKFVREKFLCQEPSAPPPNLNVTPPEVDNTRTTRERFAQHTADPTCSACHELMDPIGFGFEAYDAVGRFRTSDAGKSIDDSGWVASSADIDGPFRGARELGEKLATSAQVRDCVASQWLRYALGRFEGAGDSCSLTQLRAKFSASGGDLRELLVELTQTESFLYRRVVAPEELSPGERTLLDNTVVLWCNEVGKGNDHAHRDLPFLLAGSCGGQLRTGRFVDYQANGAAGHPHNNLLVSLARAMGGTDTTFGDPAHCTGPLTGLTA